MKRQLRELLASLNLRYGREECSLCQARRIRDWQRRHGSGLIPPGPSARCLIFDTECVDCCRQWALCPDCLRELLAEI